MWQRAQLRQTCKWLCYAEAVAVGADGSDMFIGLRETFLMSLGANFRTRFANNSRCCHNLHNISFFEGSYALLYDHTILLQARREREREREVSVRHHI